MENVNSVDYAENDRILSVRIGWLILTS